MSKLLIEESPLTFQPSLAVAIGLNEAIVLQQIHYWIKNTKNKGYEQDGYKWVYNTYAEWKESNFPFWSENTIQRTFASLEEKGLVVSIQPMKGKYDRTKYYRIEYTKLEVFDDTKMVCSLNESENTAENTTLGDKSPDLSTMPMDWKLAHGQEITADDVARMEDDKRKDAANLISIGFGISAKIAFNLAYAFQVARNITFPESKVKGQRKAIKEMLEMHVTPENVTEAVQQLTGKGMTVVDLFSVSKTAIDLANKPEVYNPNEEHRL